MKTQVLSSPPKKEPPPKVPGKNPMRGLLLGVELEQGCREFRGMPREKVLRVYERVREHCRLNSPIPKEDLKVFLALEVLAAQLRPESIQRIIFWDPGNIQIQRKPGWRTIQ